MSAFPGNLFADQHVLITGASGGIGTALVKLFASHGALISAVDRAKGSGTARDELVFELTDAAAVRQQLGELVGRRGAPDIVISNAGWTRAENVDQVDEEAFELELDINLTGAFRVLDAVLPAMRTRGTGAIVAVASVNGLAHFGNPAYSAAKAGLISYVKSLAVELGREGIRANAVCPGSVMTPAWDHRFEKDPDLRRKVLAHYPLDRLVSPEEVANTVAFLASPLASGITGAALTVDAGLTAGNLRFVRNVIGGEA